MNGDIFFEVGSRVGFFLAAAVLLYFLVVRPLWRRRKRGSDKDAEEDE